MKEIIFLFNKKKHVGFETYYTRFDVIKNQSHKY